MLTVGLTGGIATGKSTVANYFKELGAHVIDVDSITHTIIKQPEIRKRIVERFGEDIRCDDSTIDREKLGEIVFGDERKREMLEEILHPEITKEMERKTNAIRDKNAIIIKNAPLLIESGAYKRVDKVIVVYSGEENQIKRLVERDGLSRAQALKRIRAQMRLDEKMKFADVVIYNDGTLENTKKQVENVYTCISKASVGRDKPQFSKTSG